MHCVYNNEEETLSPTKKSSLLVLYEMCYDSQWKNYSNDDKLGEIIDRKKICLIGRGVMTRKHFLQALK